MKPKQKALLQLVLSVGLLVLLFLVIDAGEITAHFAHLDLRWVGPALAMLVLQIALLAWRWRFTAGRLGLHMTYGHALREYYLGVFLNQLLPGGILGDVSRAWRHARLAQRTRTVVHAVVLERLGVQSLMLGIALMSLALMPALQPALADYWVWAAIAAAWVIGLAVWGARSRFPAIRVLVAELRSDARRAFLPLPVLLAQFATALLATAANLAAFVAAARALGVDVPLGTLLPMVAPVLLVMMLPISIAGWGARESAAALLWAASGMAAAEGVAVAVAFGLLFLLAALPGAFGLIAWRKPQFVPDPERFTSRIASRTAHRPRGRTGGSAAATPDRAGPQVRASATADLTPAGRARPSGEGDRALRHPGSETP